MMASPVYLISPSQFRAHKECPKRHEYIYGLQLRPRKRETHFEVGSYFHELAHFYYQLLKADYKVGDAHTLAAMDAKLRNDIEEVADEFIPVLLKVHLVFRRYLERRTKDIDTGIEILEVEANIEHLVNDTVGIHGIVDLIYRRRGKLVIRDHKTGENKSAHSADSIDMDDQLLTYAVIIWKLFNEVPEIEISWVNSKVDYKTFASNEQLFGLYRKTLDADYLEAMWTETVQYIYHMQSTPPIRFINGYKCKSCPFKDPCQFSMRGLSTDNLIAANYKKVPRDHDYRKFTEIARKRAKDSAADNSDSRSSNPPSGLSFTFNFSGKSS